MPTTEVTFSISPRTTGESCFIPGKGMHMNGPFNARRAHIIAAVGSITVLSAAHNMLLLALPIYSLQVMSRVLPTGDLKTLLSLTALFCCAVAVDWVVEGSRAAAVSRLASEIVLDFHNQAAERAESQGDNFKLFEQTSRLKDYISGPLGLALLDAPWSSVFLLALFYLKLELGYTAILILVVTFVTGAVSSWMRASARRSTGWNIAHSNGPSYQSAGLFCNPRPRQLRFLHRVRASLNLADTALDTNIRAAGLAQAVRLIGQAALIAVTAMLVARGELALGSILATSMLFARATAPIDRCSDLAGIREVINLFRSLSERRTQILRRPALAPAEIPSLVGKLSLLRVSVQRQTGTGLAVQEISCDLPPGGVTILSGLSGSGKSALLAALAGHAVVPIGLIKIDGLAFRDIQVDQHDDLIGYLPTNPSSPSGTVMDIITGGKAPDMRAIIDAAKRIGIHEHIESLPGGYNTVFSPGNCSFSRGHEQQLWIARSLYLKPKILLLDEPTAFLDEPGLSKLVVAIDEARNEGTNVIVASRCPRISYLQDRSICLASGRLIGIFDREVIESHVARQEMASV